MPKIRDLGITVIPEAMRPLEMGPGGGGYGQYGCGPVTGVCDPVTRICDPVTRFGCGPVTQYGCGPVTQYGCGRTDFCDPVTRFCGPVSPCQRTDFCDPVTRFAGRSGSGFTLEAIQQLKQQLQQQIAQLDEYAKSIGPKTVAEIEAREQELKEELEELARRRQELES